MKSAILKSYCYIDPSAGPCILFRNWLIWLDSFDKSEILISTEMVWPGQFWQMECVLCLFRIKSSVKHSWALSLSYTNNISYTKRLSRLHLFKAIFTLYRMAFAPARKPYRIGLLFTHTAPINVNPVGGGGECRQGAGIWCLRLFPLSGFRSCEATPGPGHLTLTDGSLVSIQKRLPSPSLEASWKSRCRRKVWSFHLI